MPNSMTGYGRSRQVIDNYDVTVEIKSVNHRYFDFSIKAPKFCAFMEEDIKKAINQKVSRGKVDVFVTVRKEIDDSKQYVINKSLAENLLSELKETAKHFKLKNDITVSNLIEFRDIFEISYKEDDEEKLKEIVFTVLEGALEAFCEARAREGKKLIDDMTVHNKMVKVHLDEIKVLEPQSVADYRERLEAKIKELIGDATIDQARIVTETAIMADKLAVDEETVRLDSHLQEFQHIVESDEPVGRRLDFLMQEMNRETNTIGSKSNNLDITKAVVSIKSELEKMREQLQNLE
ncbi:MAG: YicC family protein [Clostridia bacterium]|nr:YicC family protein [Clostridia bacterium]